MNKLLLFLVVVVLFNSKSFAQCGEDTYELTLAKAGSDIVLVRDFKVKLREGNKRNPNPISRYSVLMQNGLTYRFIISKDANSASEPVLQLFDRNELLGTTGKCSNAKDTCKFEFRCKRSGNYQILISFGDSKPGCAIGFMGMVTDEAFYAQGNRKPANDKYILYTGIETPLRFYTDNTDVSRKEVTTTNGNITFKDSVYNVLVPAPGNTKITVKLFNRNDSLVESTEQDFEVVALPEPKVNIEGMDKEYITPSLLGFSVKLKVTPTVYRIEEFYLSTEPGIKSGLYSNSEYLTPEMIALLKSLAPQQRIYLNDVEIESPNGEIKVIGQMIYYVR